MKKVVNMKKVSNLCVIALVALMTFSGCKKDKDDDPSTTDAGVVINGVKCATRNVDAPKTFAATPESYGKFYQWNRATAWDATGAVTGWADSTPAGDSWTADICPNGWRVPTSAEQQTLLDATKVTNEWTTQNGVKGRLFTDKTTKANLFLPAAGYRSFSDGRLSSAGSIVSYWSSTTNANIGALYFDGADWGNTVRAYGLSVRCVAK